MSITNKLNQIKNAIYGKEVRGAIHDAIKQVYDDASVNHDNANMEVKMARGTHNTLNDRLDKSEKKLDETNAQLSQKVTVYDIVDDMLLDTNLKLNARCKTLGYREVGDGGGGYYQITEDIPNGCNILKINDNLSAKLVIEGVPNFRQLGGNGWGKNDTLNNYFTSVEDAKQVYPFVDSLELTINDVLFKVALDNFKELFIPGGVYCFNKNVDIPADKKIYGAGCKQTYLKQQTTTQFITIDGSNVYLKDFIIVSNSNAKADFGLVINGNCNFNKIENVTVQFFKTGVRVNANSFLTDFVNVDVFNCDSVGFDIADQNNVLNLIRCKINGCGTGVQCTSARNINITDSWIELCNVGVIKKDTGNLNIINTYFERNTTACIKVAWGITPCELIKVSGCSFFTNTNNSLINYHGLATTKLVIENCYFIEYDTNNTINATVFSKGHSETSMKPILKDCYLNGIGLGLEESQYLG